MKTRMRSFKALKAKQLPKEMLHRLKGGNGYHDPTIVIEDLIEL